MSFGVSPKVTPKVTFCPEKVTFESLFWVKKIVLGYFGGEPETHVESLSSYFQFFGVSGVLGGRISQVKDFYKEAIDRFCIFFCFSTFSVRGQGVGFYWGGHPRRRGGGTGTEKMSAGRRRGSKSLFFFGAETPIKIKSGLHRLPSLKP